MGIKYQLLDIKKYKFALIKNKKRHIIREKSLGLNTPQAISIARDKHKTYQILKKAGLPVLKQVKIKNINDYEKKSRLISFPQVIKPALGEKGKNIYLNVKNRQEAKKIIKSLQAKISTLIVEPYFKGLDYRFIILNNKVIGLAQRLPPIITADGKYNIKKLIKMENKRRLEFNKKTGRRMLNRILVWQRISWYLEQQKLKLTDIPPKNTKITIYPIPNFSTGGAVEAIPLKNIHPSFIKIAVKTAKVVNLALTGIDILAKNINLPAGKNNCAIIEVNSDPGLRLHDWPNYGRPQSVTEKILKYIFKS